MDPQADDTRSAAPSAQTPATRPTPPVRSAARGGLSRRATWIGGIAAVLVLGGLGWLAWHLTHNDDSAAGGPGGGGPGGRRGPLATTVGVATVAKADIPVTLEALGTVTPTATVRVAAQVGGTLKELMFREGQMVKKGQLIAQIDPRPYEMSLLQATGQRQRDEAQLENARLTLKRYQTLWTQDSIARQDLDTQAALVKQLEGTVNTDRAAEGTARINLGYTRVVAPIAGRVGLRTVDVGNVVSQGDANGLVTITAIAPIDVEFAVPQDRVTDLAGSQPGADMAATALDRTRTDTLATGRFLSLDNQVDVQTGTVRAKARFDNTDNKLFPSQFVNLRLLVRTIKDATVVPLTAVRFGNGGDYVYVLNAAERTVSTRSIKKGMATADKVVVLSGVQPGERVITEGADRLKDGAKVVLPGDPVPSAGGRGRRSNRPADGASAPASGAASGGDGGWRHSRREGASAAEAPATPSSAAPATAPAAQPPAAGAALPTAEQRQRMLDSVKDDPAPLERRKKFLEALDKGDPEALARWQQMRERRQRGESAQ